MYAFPTNPGPWYRYAVPARVMSRSPGARLLVLLPDGVPATPLRDELPRASLVWVDAASLISSWEEWPAHAASTRADMTAVVSSAVAALAGTGAPTLDGPRVVTSSSRWWSRPVGELLRPPPVPVGGRGAEPDG
jgi:hypothetical protein